ncbi:DUF4835 family protein [Bacteroides sp. 214]|uniref:type IX secretion system protein PorD n=1 Tax=Bacteroides sp. 214 TaxID=2302935 RepID=UPI0013D5F317|nr:DUF4835 family protein [Bacteroides sp. 214]NDW11901.1 DUF4835 family protein [Bacteroides sp. 214]
MKNVVLLLLLAFSFSAVAQELNCNVAVNHSQIQGTSTQVFKTLEDALKSFVNERKWTHAQYDVNERINCSINLTVKEYNDNGRFSCDLQVQATRPVWQSSYSTVIFSFRDASVDFNYLEYDPLELRDNTIDNNLTAVIAYYVYLIIGFDMDTMSLLGGTELLRSAENIVTAAQMIGETGWRAFDSNRNRHAIITDYLDEGMKPLRQLMYEYHRKGLDEMSTNSSRARANISTMLEQLKQAKENKPMSVLPQLFTEIKKDELVNIFSVGSQREREDMYTLLSQINPSLNSEWVKIKQQ